MLSRAEQWQWAITDLLREANVCRPDQLPDLVRRVTAALARDFRIYLVDFEQQAMHEFTPKGSADHQPVNGSVAGLAYQRSQALIEPGDQRIAWIPLIDSTERLGVLRVEADLPHPATAFGPDEPDMMFANLLGHLIAAKMPYGDRMHQIRCSRPMSVNATLVRQLLPPSTCTTDRLAISASLQPAYTVGGDGYDYAVEPDIAYLGIFDGVGHGLPAGMTIAVALSAIRAARRAGEGLLAQAQAADDHLAAQFSASEFVTGILLQVDLDTGRLQYLNAGHHQAVVIARNGSIRHLDGGRRLPLGLPETPAEPAHHQLRTGDRIMLYTDGAIESRDENGDFYTPERLIEHARLLGVHNETVPETARKLNQGVVDFHHGPPDDDSTILVCEWSSSAPRRIQPS